MAKPDNRADNAARLQQHIDNTEANLKEAEDYLDEHASEISAGEKQDVVEKNARRQQSIAGFAEEIKDEQGQ